jgi:uncharacterized protein YegP (UPF0339 family)
VITYCIPSKNNLRYLKLAIESIKKNSYHKDNEVFVYVDKDEDGNFTYELFREEQRPEDVLKLLGY